MTYIKEASFWSKGFGGLRSNPLALTGALLLLILSLLALIGPLLTPYTYFETHLNQKNTPPCAAFWFGTDELGRDIFTRIWWGARISLFIGIAASCIDLFIGVLFGAFAALFQGKTEEYMMRFADTLYAIPHLLVVILLMVVLGLGTILIALTITGWIKMARIVRGQTRQLLQMDFVKASFLLGASKWHVLKRHILPNCIGPICITLTLTIPSAIFAEAFLSFLGLGIEAPIASWGSMVNDSLSALRSYPWRLFFPAGFITITLLGFYLVGEALRDAFDPRMDV
jgi:oligopeptide transport system permease protein